MQVIARKTLKLFWIAHPRSEVPLRVWYQFVRAARWRGPADVKRMFNGVDFIADNRIVFDIGGNKFRLVVHVSYEYQRVLIKFIGTHAAYDRIRAEDV